MERRGEERLENIIIGVLMLTIVVLSAVLLIDITNKITGKAVTENYVKTGSGYTIGGDDLIDKGLEFLVMIADQKELLPIVLLAAIKFQDCVLSMQKMANSYLNIKNIKSLEAKHG